MKIYCVTARVSFFVDPPENIRSFQSGLDYCKEEGSPLPPHYGVALEAGFQEWKRSLKSMVDVKLSNACISGPVEIELKRVELTIEEEAL